jgi:magnesium transporter
MTRRDRSIHASETAASHLAKRVPTAGGGETVGAVRSSLWGNTYDSTDAVYLIDRSGKLQGLVSLPGILAADEGARLDSIMLKDPPTVQPGEDQERVATLAIRHRLTSVPVVDAEGTLLGVVPSSALFEVLRREHIEDMNRLVGISKENERALNAIEASPTRRLRDRLPWLLIGLLGAMAATFVVSRFEEMIEARVVIAFFVPAIVYLADAIGTQTEAVVVRGLSLSQTPLKNLLIGEMRTGLLIGLSLGAVLLPTVAVAFGDIRLAVTVASAVVVAGTCATTLGLLLPWTLSWMGKDPAFGSGPVGTVIQDVLSLLIYFVIASLLVI